MSSDDAEPAAAWDDAAGVAPDAQEPPAADLADRGTQIRLVEALLFASAEPLDEASIAQRLPEGADVAAILEYLQRVYSNRGVQLVRVGEKWAFRTAPDLAPYLHLARPAERKLSRAATEVLAIIAYHQPVTRADIETIRGVATSKGTLDTLLEAGWIRPGKRRQTPGRPVTWWTTEHFLDHFALASLDELPGLEELKKAGLIDTRPAVLALGDTSADGESDSAGDDGDAPPDPAG